MAKPSKPKADATMPAASAGDTRVYLINDDAPTHIAGKRIGDRKEIELTEHQARAELLAGHIWPKGVERQKAAPEPTSTDA